MSTVAIGNETEEEAVAEATYPKQIKLERQSTGDVEVWWEQHDGTVTRYKTLVPEGYCTRETVEYDLGRIYLGYPSDLIDSYLAQAEIHGFGEPVKVEAYRLDDRIHLRRIKDIQAFPRELARFLLEQAADLRDAEDAGEVSPSGPRDFRSLLNDLDLYPFDEEHVRRVEERLRRWNGGREGAEIHIALKLPTPTPRPQEAPVPAWVTDEASTSWDWEELPDGEFGWTRYLKGFYPVGEFAEIEIRDWQDVRADGTPQPRYGVHIQLHVTTDDDTLTIGKEAEQCRAIAAEFARIADLLDA